MYDLFVDRDLGLLLANTVCAVILAGAAGGLAARILPKDHLPLRHAVLCTTLLVMLVCPFVAYSAIQNDRGWIPIVFVEEYRLSEATERAGVSSRAAAQLHNEGDRIDSVHTQIESPVKLAGGPVKPQSNELPRSESYYGVRELEVSKRLTEPEGRSAGETEDSPRIDANIANEQSADRAVIVALPISTPRTHPNAFQVACAIGGIVWIAGVLLGVVQLLRGAWVISRLRRTLIPVQDPRIDRLVSASFRNVGISGWIRVCYSAAAPSPLTLGPGKPVIVLPAGLEGRLDDRQLECVLTHEAAHFARHDTTIGLVQRLAAIALWWNPLVHLINRQINSLREQICDDYVVRAYGGKAMAEALISVAECCTPAGRTPLGVTPLFGHSDDLFSRVTRLANKDRVMPLKLNRLSLMTSVTFALLLTSLISIPVLRAQSKFIDSSTEKTLLQNRVNVDPETNRVAVAPEEISLPVQDAQDESPPDDMHFAREMAKLKGTWRIESMLLRGKPIKQEYLEEMKSRPWRIFDGDVRTSDSRMTLKFDPSQNPPVISLTHPEMEGFRGIYKVENDTLTVCWGYETKPMPTEFLSSADNGYQLRVLRRISDDEFSPGRNRRVSIDDETEVEPSPTVLRHSGPMFLARQGKVLVTTFSGIIKDGLSISAKHPRQGIVTLWDAESLEKIGDVDTGGIWIANYQVVAVSPSGSYLAVTSTDSESAFVAVWDISNDEGLAEPLWRFDFETNPSFYDRYRTVAFSPKEDAIALALESHRSRRSTNNRSSIQFRDINSGEVLREVAMGQQTIMHLAFAPDGSKLALAQSFRQNRLVRFLDLESDEVSRAVRIGTEGPMLIQFMPDCRHLVVGNQGLLSVVDSARMRAIVFGEQPVQRNPRYFGKTPVGITAVAISHDGRWIATGGETDKPTVRVWDTNTGQLAKTYRHQGGEGGVTGLTFSADGQYLNSSSRFEIEGQISFERWNLKDAD